MEGPLPSDSTFMVKALEHRGGTLFFFLTNALFTTLCTLSVPATTPPMKNSSINHHAYHTEYHITLLFLQMNLSHQLLKYSEVQTRKNSTFPHKDIHNKHSDELPQRALHPSEGGKSTVEQLMYHVKGRVSKHKRQGLVC